MIFKQIYRVSWTHYRSSWGTSTLVERTHQRLSMEGKHRASISEAGRRLVQLEGSRYSMGDRSCCWMIRPGPDREE